MKKILFATDGSEASKKAQEVVGEMLGKWTEAALTVLYVSQTVPYYYEATPDLLANLSHYEESWAKQVEQTVMDAFKEYRNRVQFKHLVGHPATAICDLADEENADLIVVGSHGRGTIDRVLLGSVSHGVLNRAKHSVLVVRG
ncbi:MAG: universal stress protein [Kyrpidia sp.]|nr:universal stress protein [Kyrpidia sp.]